VIEILVMKDIGVELCKLELGEQIMREVKYTRQSPAKDIAKTQRGAAEPKKWDSNPLGCEGETDD